MNCGEGVPSALQEFCAWTGAELAGRESHVVGFGPSAELELFQAVAGLKAASQGVASLRRAQVPLAGLDQIIQGWNDEVAYGRGFVLIRRLPLERLTDGDARLAFQALAAHMGRACPQDEQGKLLDEFAAENARAGFASDPGDVTALLCMRAPPAGAALRLTSAVAVHNAMAAEEPRLLAELYQPGAGTPEPGEGARLPVFMAADDRLFARLAPHRSGPAGALGPCVRAVAHDHLHRHAEAFSFELDVEPGDLLLVNNHHVAYRFDGGFAPGRLWSLRLEAARLSARPEPYRDRAVWLGLDHGSLRPRAAA